VFALFLPQNTSAQGGWVKAPQEYFIQLGVSQLSSKNYYNLDGERQTSVNTFRQTSLQLYGEYGISGRLTGIVQCPVLRAHSYNTTNTVVGIGDARLSLKYGLWQHPAAIALLVAAELPTGAKNKYAVSKKANELGYKERANLGTGDGEWNFWNTLAVSYSFYPKPAYLSFYGGYNLRTKAFSDQYEFGGEAGYTFAKTVWFGLKSSVRKTRNGGVIRAPFFRGEGTEYTATSVALAYQWPSGLGIVAEYFDYSDLIVKRRNIYSAPILTIGIQLHYKKRGSA
jgi:hypothetical protein